MRFLLAILVICLLPFAGTAQQFRGRVYDGLSAAPVTAVLVTNVRTGSLWLGDSSGAVAFTALPGDEVRFQRKGYYDYSLRIAAYTDKVAISLERAPIELKEVQVLSPMARFKRDSAFNHQFFHKELGYAHSQIGLKTNGVGIGAEGLISQLALMASGKQKAARRLESEMLYLESLQFSAIRYTPTLVAAQTGLSDSASEQFILRHPIPNEFLRVASELELKMRIRELYREELSLIGNREQVIGNSAAVKR